MSYGFIVMVRHRLERIRAFVAIVVESPVRLRREMAAPLMGRKVSSLKAAVDAADWEDIIAQSRSLLHVAVTRAKGCRAFPSAS